MPLVMKISKIFAKLRKKVNSYRIFWITHQTQTLLMLGITYELFVKCYFYILVSFNTNSNFKLYYCLLNQI